MRTKITTVKPPKMNDTPAPQLDGLRSTNVHSCPFVGLKSDPETSFSYTSKSNYCHKVTPPEPLGISYQESICLKEEHQSCPIYLQDWDGPLPADIRRKVTKERHLFRRLFFLLLVLLLAGVVWLFLGGFGNPIIFSSVGQSKNTVIVSTQVPPVMDSPTPSPKTGFGFFGDEQTPTMVATNTLTMTPTSSATFSAPTPGPFLKTPFGPYDGFIVHKVAPGESVTLLAEMYDTSNEVIIAVNGLDKTYYFYGARTPRPTSDRPYLSPTPTFSEDAEPTKKPTSTKRAIPTVTETMSAKPTKTLTLRLPTRRRICGRLL